MLERPVPGAAMKRMGFSDDVVIWDLLIGYCPKGRRIIDLEINDAAVSAVMTLAMAWNQAGGG